ncbi:MAG: hypothetical protein OEY29_09620 [Gammaproteobacteria bacterium]|nr:hypothetical protein [Gammaproteobacteria bacterium]
MKNKIVIAGFISVCFSVITACSTQQDKAAGSSQTNNMAVVKGLSSWNPLSVIAVTIIRIDDKEFSRAANHEVTAGKHTIEVRCSREQPERAQSHFAFEMVLKAGHQYKPRLDMTKECHVNYIDTVTGKIYPGIEK